MFATLRRQVEFNMHMWVAIAVIATSSTLVNTPAFTASLPTAAQGPKIPEKGYLVEEVEGSLFWVTDGNYQAMFLTSGEGVILVDAPLYMGDKVAKAIAEVTDEPVTHLIYTHSHADHIAGASQFANLKAIIAHEETKARLMRANDSRRPVPTETFSDEMTVTVGTQTLELSYTGPNHEIGNIFVYAPQQQVLMLVDMVAPGWAAWRNLEEAVYVPGFYDAIDHILTFDFDVFVGGHVNRLGTRQDVEVARAYYLSIKSAAADAIETVSYGETAKTVSDPNTFSVYNAYLNEVVEQCARQVIAEWGDKLGGVGVFTSSSCGAAITSFFAD